jgi:hypothetical protein
VRSDVLAAVQPARRKEMTHLIGFETVEVEFFSRFQAVDTPPMHHRLPSTHEAAP